jgi:hypothetical protein
MNNRTTLSRKELYELVWSAPLRVLSKKYQMSDNGFRKMCKRMMIPIPNGGHWARLLVNRGAPLKLSQRYSGDPTVTLLFRDNKTVDKQDEYRRMLKETEQDLKANHTVKIFDQLVNPDELIIASKNLLNEKDGKSHKYDGMLTSEREALDICVSPENVLRALCFMDALIKSLMTMGHDVRIRHNETFAVVHDTEIKISFREKLHRVIEKGTYYDSKRLKSTGEVCFKARINMNDRMWLDANETLEQQLPAILAKLEVEGKRRAEERAYYDAQHKKREQKEKRERAIEEKKERELKMFQQMLDQSVRWRKAKDMREYIDAREQHATANNLLTEEFKRWLIWARQKADWYDPFIEAKDNLLKDIEKDPPEVEKARPVFEDDSFFPNRNWFQKSFYHKQ